jgi:hypothetical protein
MAKALFGHVSSNVDPRLLAEVTRLRARVRDLEDELARTRAMDDAIHEALGDAVLTTSDVEELREPALA